MCKRIMQPVSVLLICISLFITSTEESCSHFQYIELSQPGVIQCSFEKGYLGISWYNSTVEGTLPIVTYVRNQKSGEGYSSGEYDVYPNGSLFIRNVTIDHDRKFSVSFAQTEDEPVHVYEIEVETIVKPLVPYPVVENCDHLTTLCYHDDSQSRLIKCSVRNVRPSISLSWRQRCADHDRLLSFEQNVTKDSAQTFSSLAIARLTADLPLLTVLVCKTAEHTLLFDEQETLLVIENNPEKLTASPRKYYSKYRSTLILPCNDANTIVWKRFRSSDTMEILAIGLKLWSGNVNKTFNDNVILDGQGSLVLKYIEWHHEGTYMCLWKDTVTEDISRFDVTIFETPNPPHLVLEECTHLPNFCVLEVEREGNVTCSVYGIRPAVDLRWSILNEERLDDYKVAQIEKSPKGKSYNISLTVFFKFQAMAHKSITLQCYVTGPGSEMFDLSTTVELLPKFDTTSVNYDEKDSDNKLTISLCLAAAVLFIIVITAIGFKVKNKLRKHPIDGEDEERHPMVDQEGKKSQFITEIRTTYQLLYNAVQPIPYIKDKMYCVDKVFVESGIEVLAEDGNRVWQQGSHYNDIVNRLLNTNVTSTPRRQIVEGEPGYGKSTLALQIVYDWCNHNRSLNLHKVNILIYLRLRQLKGVLSIQQAIRKFVLPMDTKLDEHDVKAILDKCSSTLFILDGYDEYGDRNNQNTDLYNIMTGNMFQSVPVILFTRSFYLPENMAPQTGRFRLTGFDDRSRDHYIRKAVVPNNEAAIEEIKLKLEKNPVLGDICQVPLFFVMFAHMTFDGQHFQSLKFSSVTAFFRYMLSCFHSHMRNKLTDEVTRNRSRGLEKIHDELNAVAFEALSEKSPTMRWESAELRARLGSEFYKQYVKIGILVEEEVLATTPDDLIHVQYQTYVRFYHKLFCEWYAAHYVAKYLSEDTPSKMTQGKDCINIFLREMDPFDLQYLYRFSCGLNHRAAETIINYLQYHVKEQRFAILCTLEQDLISNHSEIIKQVVAKPIKIQHDDSMLLQRSTLQILDFATKKEFPVSCLHLKRPSPQFDRSTFELASGLRLPPLTTVQKIIIETHEETGQPRKFDKKDVERLCHVCMVSTLLEEIVLDGCLLPLSLPGDVLPKDLVSRKIKVSWRRYGFRLNLSSREWEVDDIRTVQRLCSGRVEFRKEDSKELQKCTLELLCHATKCDVTISDLWLRKVFKGVTSEDITLRSNLHLPCPLSVEKIWIEDENLKERDLKGIMMFILTSQRIKELIIYRCLVPKIIPASSIPSELLSRNITVTWNPNDTYYRLNLDSGRWISQRDGEEMTKETYDNVAKDY